MPFPIRLFCIAVTLAASGHARAQTESFDCVMDPPVTVRLGSAVSGLLDMVSVERGDRVVAGQLVARLNTAVERTTVDLLRVRVESRAAIEAQAARLAYVEGRLGRIRQLATRGVATQDTLEEIEAELTTAKSALQQAETEQALAEKELERAEAALAIREIRSPIDGIVVERRLSGGEYIHQEGHVVTVVRLDPLHVETFLPVERYGAVALGDVARVRPAPPVQGELEAVVAVVDAVFDAASGTFGVRLVLPNPGQNLPGGHRCRVEFDFAQPG